MNTNPKAIRILCYGDSNTWSDNPRDGSPRYAANVRWTGRLQELLGHQYEIIEEGLCGRTTIYDDPKDPDRNGLTYLKPCLLTHNPLDIVVLMLGTNDLKTRFNATAQQIARNAGRLVEVIQEIGQNRTNMSPRVILVSPVLAKEQDDDLEMKGAHEKSKEFGKYYEIEAKDHGCEFIDIAKYIQPSPVDGLHLEPQAHAKIAEVLEKKIKEMV